VVHTPLKRACLPIPTLSHAPFLQPLLYIKLTIRCCQDYFSIIFEYRRPVIKKREIIIVAAVALLAIAAIFAGQMPGLSDKPLYLVVTSNGSTVMVQPLSEDAKQTITTDAGTNTVVVTGGKAMVASADCPNQICVNSAAISQPGETIACLPHKLLLTIQEGRPQDE
jgi:hypothetical protein